MNPATNWNFSSSIANRCPITNDGCSWRDHCECNLVCFWYPVAKNQAGFEARSGRQAPFIRNNSNIVRCMDLDRTRLAIPSH